MALISSIKALIVGGILAITSIFNGNALPAENRVVPIQTVDQQSVVQPKEIWSGAGPVEFYLSMDQDDLNNSERLIKIIAQSARNGLKSKVVGVDLFYDAKVFNVSSATCSGSDFSSTAQASIDPVNGIVNLVCFRAGGSGDFTFKINQPVEIAQILVSKVTNMTNTSSINFSRINLPESGVYTNLAGKAVGISL